MSLAQAQVTWLKDGKPIREGKKYQFVEEGPVRKLIVKAIESSDQADYTCVVGQQKTQAGLFVEGKIGKATFIIIKIKVHLCW